MERTTDITVTVIDDVPSASLIAGDSRAATWRSGWHYRVQLPPRSSRTRLCPGQTESASGTSPSGLPGNSRQSGLRWDLSIHRDISCRVRWIMDIVISDADLAGEGCSEESGSEYSESGIESDGSKLESDHGRHHGRHRKRDEMWDLIYGRLYFHQRQGTCHHLLEIG
jgi:hypothetical protein